MPRKRKEVEETMTSEAGSNSGSNGPGRKTGRSESSPRPSSPRGTGGAARPVTTGTGFSAAQAPPAEALRQPVSPPLAQAVATRPEPDAAADSDETVLASAVSSREQIALLAYSYWQARGGKGGSPEEDWYRAERVIRERLSSRDGKEGRGRRQ
jgi:hypothetical protein